MAGTRDKQLDILAELAGLVGGTRTELERAVRRIAERDLKREQRKQARRMRELHDDDDDDELDEEGL